MTKPKLIGSYFPDRDGIVMGLYSIIKPENDTVSIMMGIVGDGSKNYVFELYHGNVCIMIGIVLQSQLG